MTMFGSRASSEIPASRHRPRSVGGTGDLRAEILYWTRDCLFRPPSFVRPSFVRSCLSVASLRCLRLIRERRRHEHATDNDIAPSTEHRAPSTEHRAPSTEHRAPSTEHRAPSTEHRAPSTEHRAPSTEHRAPSTEHRARPRHPRRSRRARAACGPAGAVENARDTLGVD